MVAGSGSTLACLSSSGDDRQLWRVELASGKQTQLTATSLGETPHIVWAPSKYILFHMVGNQNYAVFDPEAGTQRKLVNDEAMGWMFDLRLTPDGTRASVMRNRWFEPTGKESEWTRWEYALWTIRIADGTAVAQYRATTKPVGWSADGRIFYFTEHVTGDRDRHLFAQSETGEIRTSPCSP